MNEVYQQLISILYGIWRQRIVAISIAWIICVIGWVFVAQIPNKYGSEARIYVDEETFLKPLLGRMAVQNNVYNQVAIMRQTLISRPNITKVIRMTDQDIYINGEEEWEKKINEIIDEITINIQAANLFTIAYTNKDPAIAKMVVDSLLNIFKEENLGQNRKDMTSAVRFIEDQIRDYEGQLEISSQRKTEFLQKNMGFLSDKSYFQNLKTAQNKIKIIKQNLAESIETQKRLIGRMKETPMLIPSTGAGPALGGRRDTSVSALQNRISLLETRLDEFYAIGYKDKHPAVRIVLNQIDELKVKLEKEQQKINEAIENNDSKILQVTGGSMPNPLYDRMLTKKDDLTDEITSLQLRLLNREEEIKQLKLNAYKIPAVEAEYARLIRDNEVLKKNYESMLAKGETAKISSDLETNTDRVRFRVIEQPHEALEPSSPNRILLVIGVLVFGLAAGVFVAFILSQMHTTYSTEQKLRDSFPYPVLGCISILRSKEELQFRKRKLIMFSVMIAGLFSSSISVYFIMSLMHSA